MKEFCKCWNCNHYFIGGYEEDGFLSGYEECELGMDIGNNNCDKYNYDSNYNRYDNIDNVEDIPF